MRIDPNNKNHHIWKNRNQWWLAVVTYPTPVTAERVRINLKTKCVKQARIERDKILHEMGRYN